MAKKKPTEDRYARRVPEERPRAKSTGGRNASAPQEKQKKKGTPASKKSRRRRIKYVILALELVVMLILMAGVYVVSKWDTIGYVNLKKEDVVVNTDMNESYVNEISKGYTNIALLGVDGDGYNCDVIMICSINEDTGEIRLASVYRDTIMQMENGNFKKVNQAINQGDYGTSQINTLNLNLDLNLDEYVVVNWTAVALAINLLGGVDVDVTEAMMREINGYITNTVSKLQGGLGSYQLAGPGFQHLDGVQAVAYCRLRHQDSDLGRTQRQREILGQLLEKAKQADIGTLNNLVNTVFPYITTTMDLNEVLGMAGNIGKYYMGPTTGFPFYSQSIQSWRTPGDWPLFALNLENNVIQLHEFLYGTKNYQPSSSVSRISQILEGECGLPTPETTPFSTE